MVALPRIPAILHIIRVVALIAALLAIPGNAHSEAPATPSAATPVNSEPRDPAAFDENGDGLLSPDELRAFITADLDSHIFPSTFAPSVDDMLEGFDGGLSYEEAHMPVVHAQICSWMNAYIVVRDEGDPEHARNTLIYTRSIINTTYGVTAEERTNALEALSQEQQGNPQVLERYLAQRCTAPLTDPTPATPAASSTPTVSPNHVPASTPKP